MSAAGYRLIEIEEAVSTNAECLEAARRGDPGGLWVRAERQTAGRGSRGRAWTSIPGNLLASLLLVDPAPARQLANLTFVAALAVRDALVELSAAHRRPADIAVKWPNDVLVNGRKTSGILLEHHSVAGRSAVVVGIGINCIDHPSDTLHAATDLTAEGLAVSARDMMRLLADRMAARIVQWDRGTGFAAIRADWLAHAHGLGRPVTVRLPGKETAGVFRDVSDEGYLVLSLPSGGTDIVAAADIFFTNGEHIAHGGS